MMVGFIRQSDKGYYFVVPIPLISGCTISSLEAWTRPILYTGFIKQNTLMLSW
jgi:hypothetical protein